MAETALAEFGIQETTLDGNCVLAYRFLLSRLAEMQRVGDTA